MRAKVPFKEVREHLDDMSPANFNKNIRKLDDFQQFLADNDFIQYTVAGRKHPNTFTNGGFVFLDGEEDIEEGWVAEPSQVSKGGQAS